MITSTAARIIDSIEETAHLTPEDIRAIHTALQNYDPEMEICA